MGSMHESAQRTVWYEVTQDSTGAPFDQSTLVMIDTGGSTFPSALAVFSDSIPTFKQATPVLPTNTVACDRNPVGNIPSVVSFLTKRGHRYFLLAGVHPSASLSGMTSLRLSMRILDVETPVVSILLPNAPDVSRDFEYTVGSPDATASGPHLAVTQRQLGKTTTFKPVDLGARCGVKGRLKAGQYCVNGSSVFVHWQPLTTSSKVTGTVAADYTDRAGNVGHNSLQTQLRDRVAPVLSSNTDARWTRRGRLFVITTCFGGPGSIEIETQVGARKRSVGTVGFKHKTLRLKKAFPKAARRSTFIHVICRDRSGNADDTWLFLPR